MFCLFINTKSGCYFSVNNIDVKSILFSAKSRFWWKQNCWKHVKGLDKCCRCYDPEEIRITSVKLLSHKSSCMILYDPSLKWCLFERWNGLECTCGEWCKWLLGNGWKNFWKDLKHPTGVSYLELGNLSVVPLPVTSQPSLIWCIFFTQK